MTVMYVHEKIQEIKFLAKLGDFEAAYKLEIDLMKEFINYAATDGGKAGRDDLRRIAKAIKQAFSIDFKRVTS